MTMTNESTMEKWGRRRVQETFVSKQADEDTKKHG